MSRNNNNNNNNKRKGCGLSHVQICVDSLPPSGQDDMMFALEGPSYTTLTPPFFLLLLLLVFSFFLSCPRLKAKIVV